MSLSPVTIKGDGDKVQVDKLETCFQGLGLFLLVDHLPSIQEDQGSSPSIKGKPKQIPTTYLHLLPCFLESPEVD